MNFNLNNDLQKAFPAITYGVDGELYQILLDERKKGELLYKGGIIWWMENYNEFNLLIKKEGG